MLVEIEEVRADKLSHYAKIPIAFEVGSEFRVELVNNGLEGFRLFEEKVALPYIKDYDAYEGGGPERWPERFDISNWGIFLARKKECYVGGATIAFFTPDVQMLGHKDLAVLWDIRVHPDSRHCGIGTELLAYAANWSRELGCKLLKIETQNVNVPACRFYAKQGCRLGEIDLYGYAGHPRVAHEVKLVWYMSL